MPVATTISTSSHHHRSQAYGSHSLPYQAYEGDSTSTLSDSSEGVKTFPVADLRRVRAEACEKLPEERRLRAKRAMTPHTPRRSYSDSKANAKDRYAKEPRVVVQELRRSGSEHRHHHHRRYEREDEREGERVYVYKAHKKNEGEVDRFRPSTRRRSTTIAGEASGKRHERLRTGDRELQRRHSERRPSHHEEKVHTPLRREKRSIADYTPKSTRERASATR